MKRRQFSPGIKKKIAIEAIKEQRTINEIANEYQVHPVQIRKWKKELVDGAAGIFKGPRRQSDSRKQEQEESVLQQKVGQLVMENDWLKKNSVFNH